MSTVTLGQLEPRVTSGPREACDRQLAPQATVVRLGWGDRGEEAPASIWLQSQLVRLASHEPLMLLRAASICGCPPPPTAPSEPG